MCYTVGYCVQKQRLENLNRMLFYTPLLIANVEHPTLIFLLRMAQEQQKQKKKYKDTCTIRRELSSLLCTVSVHSTHYHECLHSLTIFFVFFFALSEFRLQTYNFRSASCRELKFKLKTEKPQQI